MEESMEVIVPKRQWTNRKRAFVVGGTGLIVSGLSHLWMIGTSSLQIDYFIAGILRYAGIGTAILCALTLLFSLLGSKALVLRGCYACHNEMARHAWFCPKCGRSYPFTMALDLIAVWLSLILITLIVVAVLGLLSYSLGAFLIAPPHL
jgi:hypothetical protein